MAKVSVIMPQMGESLAEGTIVRWLKAPGDRVGRDEPLFEISTDKVDTDVPSPHAGVLREILVPEGATVEINAAVATIETESDQWAAPSTPAPRDEEAAQPAGHFKSSHAPLLVSFKPAGRKPATNPEPEPIVRAIGHGPGGSSASARHPQSSSNRSYSPAVLDAVRAGRLSLDTLTGMPGTGRGGRVTKRDVERFLRSPSAGARSPATSPESPPPEFSYRPGPGDRVEPMSITRRRIARHMTWSARISPQATAFAECDMSAAAAVLEGRQRFEAEVGAPLTYTVVVAHAAVAALRDFPVLNASVVDEAIVVKPAVNLGIAVALADADELVVPVVRGADGLTLEGLARAIGDLVGRARERRLRPEEVQGGSFTLTNPGVFGGLGGTPILHQPQVAILGLGAVTRRPVVIGEAIAIRPIAMLSLTFDHRAADGMIAFRYLEAVRKRLERVSSEGS